MEESVTLRCINCDMGTLSQSDGSAIYTSGETCVVASVNGPCVMGHKKLLIDEAVVDVCFRPKIGQTSLREKMTEATLLKISEVAILRSLYPRQVISIVVQELEDRGGLLACTINALCVALINCGLAMNFLFAAVCTIIDEDGSIVVDPDVRQLKTSKATFTLAFDEKGNIVSTDILGIYNEAQLSEVIEKSQVASSKIFKFYREMVRKYSDRISL